MLDDFVLDGSEVRVRVRVRACERASARQRPLKCFCVFACMSVFECACVCVSMFARARGCFGACICACMHVRECCECCEAVLSTACVDHPCCLQSTLVHHARVSVTGASDPVLARTHALACTHSHACRVLEKGTASQMGPFSRPWSFRT